MTYDLGSRRSAIGERLSALGSRLTALGSRLSANAPRVLVLVLVTVALAAPALAQPAPFRTELAGPGARVFVVDTEGVERRARLVTLDDTGLRVRVPDGERVIPWDEIAQVEWDGDDPSDGALKGALIGGGFYAVMSLILGGGSEYVWEAAGAGAMLWGTVGLIVDAAHRGRTNVYVAPGVSLDRRGHTPARRGLIVGARFEF